MDHLILYFECNSGISGDMTVAALLDLGADRQVLMEALNSLPLSGYSIEIKDVFKSGIRACDFNVLLQTDNHDHDMEYLHGDAAHIHADSTAHSHAFHSEALEDIHTQSSHHHHGSRNLHDVIEIIKAGNLTDRARALAIRTFQILAEAEAFVHGKNINEVHFHEVGAVDSIVDIVAAAVCIDNLQVEKIVFSPLTDGIGQIRCQHGLMPIPVPAVTAIATQQNLILKTSSIEGELVTPTGAAIAAAAATGDVLPDEYLIRKLGFGAGKRKYQSSGLLRTMLLEPHKKGSKNTVLTMETNIDDCTGEALSYTIQQLFQNGVLDAYFMPIYMKKNRPAYLLRVICRPEDRECMESIIFQNTTTIGIRYQEMNRTKLERRVITVETPWGTSDIKCCTYGKQSFCYPENDSICKLSKKNQIGFSEMYRMVQDYAIEANLSSYYSGDKYDVYSKPGSNPEIRRVEIEF